MKTCSQQYTGERPIAAEKAYKAYKAYKAQADVLRIMGEPKVDWCLTEIRGITWDAWIRLLDRAGEIEVLSSFGGG